MTRCEQLDSLLMEQGEGICPLEAIHDQVGSVVSSELEGASAVDGCTRSLGGYEGPGNPCGDTIPHYECGPGVCVVEMCVYK